MLESITLVTDSLTPSVTFSSNITFTSDVCYNITVSVKNCANEGDGATASPTYFRLQGIVINIWLEVFHILLATFYD